MNVLPLILPLTLAALLMLPGNPPPAAQPTTRSAAAQVRAETLPPESDLALLAPSSFRARFRLTSGDSTRDIELWRSGVDQSLIRFLERDRGQ